jgi:UPF0716 protein FxsA
MAALLVLLFLVMPFVELYVILKVGAAIGVLPTIGLLLLDSVLGAWLVKREGAKAWAAFRRAIEEGRVPARETADGALVILGGALLLTPGFVTDVIGLVCVLPPTRALVRRAFVGMATSRATPVRWFVVGHSGAENVDRVQRVRSRRVPYDDTMPAAGRRPANAPPPHSLPPDE